MRAFGGLQELRTRPIPDQSAIRNRPPGWRAKIPIDRSGSALSEPLADIHAHGIAGENFYYSERNPPYWRRIDGAVPHLLARVSVADRLANVNAMLKPFGLELFVFDAWRPRAVQAYFHDEWMPAELQRRDPSLTGDALWREVNRYWSAPTTNEDAPAPHSTGSALDLTLRWIGGDPLWMGSLFDDASAIAHRDRMETHANAMCFSDEEARANRRLLHWIMDAQGFVGYSEEWWHFSYGDQYWAGISGAPMALYGKAKD
ncbi:MAG TPA: M15 family metallopeptidase [Rhizomicrobium sp.]|nr:M15 family metallopeptidase [Rhizomicrobium sp.]